MPKQPPNDVLAMIKVGLGFARFAADAKTTAERLPLPVGEGWGGGNKPSASATALPTRPYHPNPLQTLEYP